MKRFSDYNPFAWLYANYWGHEFHEEALPVLEKLLLKKLPAKAAILDLCCGDGRITYELVRRGFQVTGVDSSEEMLTYAKQRVPKANFLLADARAFQLPPRFDAAISTFDSLNHVMNGSDLTRVFRNVHAALKAGGCFVFDLNEAEAYRDLWSRDSHTVAEDIVSIARGTYDQRRGTAHCDITLFRLEDETWHRSDFRLSQRFHSRNKVALLMKRAGFSAELHDAQQLGMWGDIGFGRTFYVARKT